MLKNLLAKYKIIFLTIFKVTWFHSTSSEFGIDHLIVFEMNQIIHSHTVDSEHRHPLCASLLPRSTIFLIQTWQLTIAAVRAYFFSQSRQNFAESRKNWRGAVSNQGRDFSHFDLELTL